MSITIKRGAAIWAVAGALLLAWSGLAAGVNAGANDRVKDDRAQAAKVERFYSIIGDRLPGNEPGPATKLARDLRDLPVDELGDFEGDTNRYGGATDELGFDPFEGSGCPDCGALSSEVVITAERAKTGQLDAVIDDIEAEIEPAETFSGTPELIWFLWFISFPATAGVIYMRQRSHDMDRFRDFPDEKRVLAQLRQAKNELPPGSKDWLRLDDLADRLEEQLETRASYRKSKAQAIKLDALTTEASDVLDAVSAGNRELN